MSDKLEDLSEITATPTSQLKFVTDAWSQVVDCRRMLKWTYAFGYYRFAEQSVASKPQQEFFEFNQVCAVPETLIAAVGHDSLRARITAFACCKHNRPHLPTELCTLPRQCSQTCSWSSTMRVVEPIPDVFQE